MTDTSTAIFNVAKSFIGTKEVAGASHNPDIVRMFAASGHKWVQDDETPWCAAFVGAVLAQLGFAGTNELRAKSYETWGRDVTGSVKPGDVVVLWRGERNGPMGHVGFFVRFEGDQVYILGGNQGDAVNIAPFPIERVVAYRRYAGSDSFTLPLLQEGSKGPHVRDLQEYLRQLEYNLGSVDGVFGKLTKRAVMEFQETNSLEIDGIVGEQTWNALLNSPLRRRRRNRLVTEEELLINGDPVIVTITKAKKLLKTVQAVVAAGGIAGAGLTVTDLVMAFRDVQGIAALLQGLSSGSIIIVGIAVVGHFAAQWLQEYNKDVAAARGNAATRGDDVSI